MEIQTTSCIHLPRDQYAHDGAVAEWWWHIGTLKAADGQIFGYEVNATGRPFDNFGFTQICITDVTRQAHFAEVYSVVPLPSNWAEANACKPWRVSMGNHQTRQGSVVMTAPARNPYDMSVTAAFVDSKTGTPCQIELNLGQEVEPATIVPSVPKPPLYVWGTGCAEINPQGNTPLTRNNYYYSLTRLNARGSISIGGNTTEVVGLTWMDHEYGFFPRGSKDHPVIWTLQDMQLTNGTHISNYTESGIVPRENVSMPSHMTVLGTDGKSTYLSTTTIPLGPSLTSAKGITYFTNFKILVNKPNFMIGEFIVTSLMPNQIFVSPNELPDIYEGVAKCTGVINKQPVSGTSWIEQSLG